MEGEEAGKLVCSIIQGESHAQAQLVHLVQRDGENVLSLIYEKLLDQQLPISDKQALYKTLTLIVEDFGELCRPFAPKMFSVLGVLALQKKEAAQNCLFKLCSNVGLAYVIAHNRLYIDSVNTETRHAAAAIFAVAAQAFGISSLLPFIKALCISVKSPWARESGMKIIELVAMNYLCSPQYTASLVECIRCKGRGLHDDEEMVRTQAALAIAELSLCLIAQNQTCLLDQLHVDLQDRLQSAQGKELMAVMKALGRLVGVYTRIGRDIISYGKKQLASSPGDITVLQTVLGAIKEIFLSDVELMLKAEAIDFVLKSFWNDKLLSRHESLQYYIEYTCLAFFHKPSLNMAFKREIILRVVDFLQSDSFALQNMALVLIWKKEKATEEKDCLFSNKQRKKLVKFFVANFANPAHHSALFYGAFKYIFSNMQDHMPDFALEVSAVFTRETLEKKFEAPEPYSSSLFDLMFSLFSYCKENETARTALCRALVCSFEKLSDEFFPEICENMLQMIEELGFYPIKECAAEIVGILERKKSGDTLLSSNLKDSLELNKLSNEELMSVSKKYRREGKYSKSLNALKIAGERGVGEALCELGVHYHMGTLGLTTNSLRALHYCKMSAEKGCPRGFLGYARQLVANGKIGESNEWFAKALETKDEYVLGIMYDRGWTVDVDKEKALECFKKGAENNHIDATYMAGYHYIVKKADEESLKVGMEYCRRAALDGHALAQCMMGRLLKVSDNPWKRDLTNSWRWYAKASSQGFSMGKRALLREEFVNFDTHEHVRNSILAAICCRKYRREEMINGGEFGRHLGHLVYDVFMLIMKALWETRNGEEWRLKML